MTTALASSNNHLDIRSQIELLKSVRQDFILSRINGQDLKLTNKYENIFTTTKRTGG